jgi:hypothetical protein
MSYAPPAVRYVFELPGGEIINVFELPGGETIKKERK